MSNIVQDFTDYRIRSIEVAEAKYYETLIATLDKIEKEVVSLVNKDLPKTNDLKLFNLKAAITVQPKIREILEREYLRWSDTVVREGFTKQAKRIERAFREIGNIPVEFQQLTEANVSLIQNLKRQSFTQFKDVSNTFTRRISEKVYQYTLTGSDPIELEDDLRRTINGIYASAKDEDVNKMTSDRRYFIIV